MKKFTQIALATLVMMCFALRGNAKDNNLAPLNLFINGPGKIVPLQDGQLLEVGSNYHMTAVPDPGCEFCGWQPVDIFTDTQIALDQNGNSITNISTGTIVGPVYSNQRDLKFTMQYNVLFDSINNIETEAIGWQANFIAKPNHR